MKKSDLRTGMIVELINGDRGRVLLETKNGNIISGKDIWFSISSEYEEDLIPVRKHRTISKILIPRENCDYGSIGVSESECKVIHLNDKVSIIIAGVETMISAESAEALKKSFNLI